MESEESRRKRFSQTLITSRQDAGLSQEEVADLLGVSRRTVQNWETGRSAPDLYQAAKWFAAVGSSPIHYFIDFLIPDLPGREPGGIEDDEKRQAMIAYIKTAPISEIEALLYLIYGGHGSSWKGLLQLFLAHVHTSIRARVFVAHHIKYTYDLEKLERKLVGTDGILPDLTRLQRAINAGEEAVLQEKEGYCYDESN